MNGEGSGSTGPEVSAGTTPPGIDNALIPHDFSGPEYDWSVLGQDSSGPKGSKPPDLNWSILSDPKEQAKKELEDHRAKAVRIIGRASEVGVFTTNQSKSAAEWATMSGGQDTKAVLAALRTTGDYVSDGSVDPAIVTESYNALSENFEITVDGKIYKLSDLETERSDPNTTKERKAEIERIIDEGLTVELTPGEAINQAVDEQIASLTGKIAEAEKLGGDVKKEKEILGRLKGLTGGHARNAIAISSFRQLQKMGVTGLDQVIARGAGLEAVSRAKIIETLRSSNYTDSQIENILMPQILNGNINALREGGVLAKPGVDLLFFERSLSDTELQERLASIYPAEAEALWKKHGKNAALAILILIAMGVYPNVKKMIVPG